MVQLFYDYNVYTAGHRKYINLRFPIMEIAKYIFFLVASITLFGVFGGLDPTNSIMEMAVRAVLVGLVFSGFALLKEAKEFVIQHI